MISYDCNENCEMDALKRDIYSIWRTMHMQSEIKEINFEFGALGTTHPLLTNYDFEESFPFPLAKTMLCAWGCMFQMRAYCR